MFQQIAADRRKVPQDFLSPNPEISDMITRERHLPALYDPLELLDVVQPDLDSETDALGIKWLVRIDEFQYASESTPDTVYVTEPIVVTGRMIFQEATRLKLPWDEPVPQPLADRWRSWWSELDTLQDLRFPRCLTGIEDLRSVELHHFSDSSEKAYGSCTYMRSVDVSGQVKVELVTSKVRLAPLSTITIPRLELCAAVLSVRADEFLRKALDLSLDRSVFWTDSQVVLGYIMNDSHRYKVFVGNRVSYIRRHTQPDQWNHVVSKSNPADVLSRGCIPSGLPDAWSRGPDFLRQEVVSCGGEPVDASVAPNDPEVRQGLVAVADMRTETSPLDQLINHYGEYYKLLKATAWWLRFVQWLRSRREKMAQPLSSDEIKVAEQVLVKHVQVSSFHKEIDCLLQGRPVSQSSSLLSLDPRLMDGLLVVGGRLRHADISYRSRHPIILPKRHPFSRLVMLSVHNRAHLGAEWTLCLLRRKFWIPSARNELRHIRNQCVSCRRMYGTPKAQFMADLPADRCNLSSVAFQHVGVDLFGPLYVSQRRSTVKRYGCVFTCMATRALHIEVLHSLDTDSFINGFRRFCARRGHPDTVRSDRGTNLVGAHAELSGELKALDAGKVVRAARKEGIDWSFNTPTASHHGGVWERMIRTIRKVLMAVIPVSSLTDEVLVTVMCEVENLINSRPLTRVSSDSDDLDPLTPNHVLVFQGNQPPAWRDFSPGEVLRRKWKLVQSIVASFWKRWLHEYLSCLQTRAKWTNRQSDYKVGDLVLLMDDLAPRGKWPLGMIDEVYPSADGHIRSVRVRTQSTVLQRPITKVVPLEMG